jgi:hypothetical protein
MDRLGLDFGFCLVIEVAPQERDVDPDSSVRARLFDAGSAFPEPHQSLDRRFTIPGAVSGLGWNPLFEVISEGSVGIDLLCDVANRRWSPERSDNFGSFNPFEPRTDPSDANRLKLRSRFSSK